MNDGVMCNVGKPADFFFIILDFFFVMIENVHFQKVIYSVPFFFWCVTFGVTNGPTEAIIKILKSNIKARVKFYGSDLFFYIRYLFSLKEQNCGCVRSPSQHGTPKKQG